MISKSPVAIEVRPGDWIVFHASIPAGKSVNDWWKSHKARIVLRNHLSTLYQRVSAEERGIDWHKENKVYAETYVIHGSVVPLFTMNLGLLGILWIGGLSQVEDYLLGVELLSEYLGHKSELD